MAINVANSKVGLIVFTTMVLAMCFMTAEGVDVSIGSQLDSPLTVHCFQDKKDVGVHVVQPQQEFRFHISFEFHGTYVCGFMAAGKATATFDVIHSRCNCDTFNGCKWVARKDGFYCNNDFIRKWG